MKLLELAKLNLEKDKELLPTLIVSNEKGESAVIGLGNFEGDNKQKIMQIAGQKLAEMKFSLQEVIFISDTWVVVTKDKPANKNIVPSLHPDRKEAIIITRWNLVNREKEISSQFYHREGDKIIWEYNEFEKDAGKKLWNDTRFFIIEEFVKSYLLNKK